MTKPDPRATLADKFYAAFVRKDRDQPNEFGDKHFYSLTKESPKWMTDAIHKAHGDIMPNDWIYDAAHSMVERMSDTTPDQWEDSASAWADGGIDVYNAARARWLASNLDFGSIVDEAVEELGITDMGIYDTIGAGQGYLLDRIARTIIEAVTNEAATLED